MRLSGTFTIIYNYVTIISDQNRVSFFNQTDFLSSLLSLMVMAHWPDGTYKDPITLVCLEKYRYTIYMRKKWLLFLVCSNHKYLGTR